MRRPLHHRGLEHLVDADEPAPPQALAYGPEPGQEGDLRIPAGAGPHPVVVLLHGGFWHVPWDRGLMTAAAADLAARGVATWNVEYARVGLRRGGWPGTFEDVAAAVDHLAALADEHPVDTARVAVLGHSAGGQLAMWAASRAGLPPDAPGAAPRVTPAAALSLAGVLDLAISVSNDVGGGAVSAFLGADPETEPQRYRLASPIERLPLGIPQLLVAGEADDVVPAWMAVEYQTAALRLGDDCRLVVVAGEDHMALIDPRRAAWAETAAWLAQHGWGS